MLRNSKVVREYITLYHTTSAAGNYSTTLGRIPQGEIWLIRRVSFKAAECAYFELFFDYPSQTNPYKVICNGTQPTANQFFSKSLDTRMHEYDYSHGTLTIQVYQLQSAQLLQLVIEIIRMVRLVA